jgi:hypothetical protein
MGKRPAERAAALPPPLQKGGSRGIAFALKSNSNSKSKSPVARYADARPFLTSHSAVKKRFKGG